MPLTPDDPSGSGRISGQVEDSLIAAVIRTVAVRSNRKPEELPDLNAVVDPDCLNAIFQARPDGSPRRGGVLEFSYAGHRVRVTGDEEIVVEVEPMDGRR